MTPPQPNYLSLAEDILRRMSQIPGFWIHGSGFEAAASLLASELQQLVEQQLLRQPQPTISEQLTAAVDRIAQHVADNMPNEYDLLLDFMPDGQYECSLIGLIGESLAVENHFEPNAPSLVEHACHVADSMIDDTDIHEDEIPY